MESKDKIEEIKNAIGVTTEVSYMFFVSSMRTGFSPDQAMDLTKTFMQTMMMIAIGGKGGSEK